MVQTIKYEIVKKIDEVEIRHYPKIVIAKVNKNEIGSIGFLFLLSGISFFTLLAVCPSNAILVGL